VSKNGRKPIWIAKRADSSEGSGKGGRDDYLRDVLFTASMERGVFARLELAVYS
jgi:hypothetical protein